MKKSTALDSFWNSFEWVAVNEQSLYDEDTLRDLGDPSHYISYEQAVGDLDRKLALSGDLWHNSTSWDTVEAKAEEIYDAIGLGGILIAYDGGALWITRGDTPYAPMAAAENVRRIHFNIYAEYLSA